MLTHFPRYFSVRAILCYVITLVLVSSIFISYAMPFQFMLFGLVPVLLFFPNANKLSMTWSKFSPKTFKKKLFLTALIIRILYVVFVYFYYIHETGIPHMFHPGDELLYEYYGRVWKSEGFEEFRRQMKYGMGLSDSGYCYWLAFEHFILGYSVFLPRIVKCVIDAVACVLMYNLAKRNFGEAAGRLTAIFYMLMPNMWYYCGITLKESEMAFMVILFTERADNVFNSKVVTIKSLLFPAIIMIIMFSFRTALAACLVASLGVALVMSSGKQLETWKKIVYGALFGVWMIMTVGAEIIEETDQLWAGRTSNQSAGYEFRAERKNGNTFAQYASATLFAPAIFTIPFSSMVHIQDQENQMMMNGANFIKNVMSGFTIFTMLSLLFSGEWRKHVLPIAVMCGYLVVLVFSNFAHSERFHFPVLGLELMFAAAGIVQMKNKHKRWFMMWLMFVCMANIGWAWIKLAGRGLA